MSDCDHIWRGRPTTRAVAQTLDAATISLLQAVRRQVSFGTRCFRTGYRLHPACGVMASRSLKRLACWQYWIVLLTSILLFTIVSWNTIVLRDMAFEIIFYRNDGCLPYLVNNADE